MAPGSTSIPSSERSVPGSLPPPPCRRHSDCTARGSRQVLPGQRVLPGQPPAQDTSAEPSASGRALLFPAAEVKCQQTRVLFSGLAAADGCASLRSAQRRAQVQVRAALSYDNQNQPRTASAEPQTKALKTASQLNALSARGLCKTGTQQPRSPLHSAERPVCRW